MITSRVHPGEVGSSHACNGMLNYLVSDSETATKLRKEFMFWIIPILNPDGVFNGNNRMDALGQNLNRFYHLPDK
jgi:murein tripeptide amidase MpaA